MRRGAAAAALVLVLMAGGRRALAQTPESEAEQRVLAYIREHLEPGQPLEVSRLYNQVFTSPAERQALDKLYRAFFRIPIFIVRYQRRFGTPPSLKAIAEQFSLGGPEASEVLLQVMESDPRVPRFITRDPKTGEIEKVDATAIESDPRFSSGMARRLGGWKGEAAPEFALDLLGGRKISSADLKGRAFLLYIWFTGCPPCMKQAPVLQELENGFSSKGFAIVGANADGVLHLPYNDAARERYLREEKISFAVANWSSAADQAYGHVTIFPTMFLVDGNGVIAGHWVGYTDGRELRTAIERVLRNKTAEAKLPAKSFLAPAWRRR